MAASILLWDELVVDNQDQRAVDASPAPVIPAQGSGSSDRDRQGRRPGSGWFIAAGVLVLVLASWGGWWYLSAYWYGSDMATRGQFGDLFGGVNTLFTGLAFVALIYTLYLQRTELEMQREDLELTRKELRNSVEAQRGSQDALTKQVELLERSSRLSAISTLVASYARELDNIAEDDVRIERELNQRRERLRHSKDSWGQGQYIRQLSADIKSLEAQLSANQNERNATNLRHKALVLDLETLVEAATKQTSSEVGNIPSEEAVGGPGATPPTPPQTSRNNTT